MKTQAFGLAVCLLAVSLAGCVVFGQPGGTKVMIRAFYRASEWEHPAAALPEGTPASDQTFYVSVHAAGEVPED